MVHSHYLASLKADERRALEGRLLDRQSRRCFICNDPIALLLHGQLDVDHAHPVVEGGLDAEHNCALTHLSCNRRKGASDLRVARRLAEFERLQRAAQESGNRGANLAMFSTDTTEEWRSSG